MTPLVVALVVGLASALVLHELGHVVAAWLCGGRVERVCWRGLGAHVVATLPHRRATVAFLLAGAAANLAAAAVGGALAFAVESSTMAAAAGLGAGMHVAHAAFALWPSGASDGARVRELVRASSRGER